MTETQSKFLRQVLVADGITSGVTGLGLVLMPGRVADLIAAPSASLVLATGVGLILFGLVLIRSARHPVPSRGGTAFAATLNLAWVVGSVAVVLSGALSALGNWALILVGIVVLIFAVLELRNLPDRGDARYFLA